MTETTRTAIAFDAFRAGRSLKPMSSEARRYDGDTDQMAEADGLQSWVDGGAGFVAGRPAPPVLLVNPTDAKLWVVTEADVLHAAEHCGFGAARGARCVKHSNLTGGGEAYVGGELLFVDGHTIVVSGCSGRYGVQDAEEMRAVANAFRRSGYGVWSMGYNMDTARPAMFGTQDAEWVAG